VALFYFSLYVMLDMFSRYVVGWLLAERRAVGSADRSKLCRTGSHAGRAYG